MMELELKGWSCPHVYTKAMLTLMDMEIDEVLKIKVDNTSAVMKVPTHLKREGYEILGVDQINKTDWIIIVKNTEFVEKGEPGK